LTEESLMAWFPYHIEVEVGAPSVPIADGAVQLVLRVVQATELAGGVHVRVRECTGQPPGLAQQRPPRPFTSPLAECLWINRWRAEDPETIDRVISLYEGALQELKLAQAEGRRVGEE
jgi:hypothetical protein